MTTDVDNVRHHLNCPHAQLYADKILFWLHLFLPFNELSLVGLALDLGPDFRKILRYS